MKNIALDKSVLKTIVNSKEAVASYVLLRSILNNENNDKQLLTINNLAYLLTGELPSGDKQWKRRLKESLYTGIDFLAKQNLIEVKEIDNKEFFVDAKKISIIKYEEGDYEKINLTNLQKIYKKGKLDGIVFFIMYILLIGDNNGVLIKSRMDACNLMDVNIRTFDKHIKSLEELDIIYVYRYKGKYATTKKSPNNIYGMNNEKSIQFINEVAEKHIEECDIQ